MLVEAGPVIMQQLARNGLKVDEIERLFISHAHGDHALGFPMLALNRASAPTPLHVYAGATTIDTLQILGRLAFRGLGEHLLSLHWYELSETAPDAKEIATGIRLRTTAIPHPPGVPTLAARWDFADGPSITYATDTVPNPATVELARDSDLLIHEASYSAVLQPDSDPGANCHSTAQEAGEIARQAGCPRLALVHLGPETGKHPEVLIEEARGDDAPLRIGGGSDLQVIVPEDGERIRVG
jgi:ribonuclease Z